MGLTEATELLPRLQNQLPKPLARALAAVIRAADAEGRTLYLVGGCVRDLALGRDLLDIDLAVEGEVQSLAAAAATLGGRWIAHDAFGTGTLEIDGARVDLAMARAETYIRPGALPRVRPASVQEDLARRDFTINALALALCGPERGRLLDPFGGWEDLRRGLVRVLHPRSFIDDATRILRAVRYAARLRFRLEPDTRGLLQRDLSYLHTISGARVRQELLRLLAEERPETALLACNDLDVLAAVHHALRFDRRLATAFRSARAGRPADLRPRLDASAGPELYLALLGTPLSPEEAGGVARRLALTARERRALAGAASLGCIAPELAQPRLRPSQVVARLEAYPEASLWAWALAGSPVATRRRIKLYLTDWCYVKSSLDGRALLRLGVPKGALVGEAMRTLRAARLDGRIRTREQDVAAVRRLLRERNVSS
jgi:tRNA nucleotidyltransferase (CCA-adding enzyme)